MAELNEVTGAADSAGKLASIVATRGATEDELRAIDVEQRLLALKAAMKTLNPKFVPPAKPNGYRAPTVPK